MSVIKVLSESLSNKIAAGEVVERPASVVKELVENAIDAGSTQITLQVERGGMSLIRVSDNGTGMARDDALLSLERYATSKLADEQSLYAISTLGFRGEALPSIAAVSKFNLVSRDTDADAATEINVSGGKITNVRDVGAPVGTMIEVRQLFFNIPARRKFLKSTNTEMGHIADMMTAFALCRHDIHFKLSHDAKEIKNWPAASRPADRIAEALGRDTRNNLHEISFVSDPVNISGWISAPHITRRSSQKIYLFVNGRMVRDRGLQYALFEGYRGRLVKGTYPVAVVFITVPFDRVDVNVHPTKNEVRFSDQRRIYESLKTAIENVWKAEPDLPWEKGAGWPPPRQRTEPFGVAEPDAAYAKSSQQLLPGSSPRRQEPFLISKESTPETQNNFAVKESSSVGTDVRDPAFCFSNLAIVGQLHNAYIVCESERGIILIDQHAAHERVIFEKLKKRAKERKPVNQGLLIPETVELTYREAAAIEHMLPAFEQCGLLIEQFGQNTFAIKAVPELLADADATLLIQELAGKLAEIGLSSDMDAKLDEFISVMACHGAIRANRRLNEKEIQALLDQMDGCDNPWHCPHGRPTTVHWTIRDIEKSFKRIV